MTSLVVEKLTIGFTRPLVRDLSFTLAAGEAIAVLGKNGSGKTTLFRTLLGLVTPLRGNVRADATPVSQLTPEAIARVIAYVPQTNSAALGLSVIEVVEMARAPHLAWYARPRARDREIAMNALAELNMADFAERPIDQLSGGERQLVLIARALAAEAPIILMDEPTANLDFGNQFTLLDEIAKLKARGLAVMFTTHAPDHALRIADRTLTLNRDGVAEIGPTADILTAARLSALYDMPIALVPHANGVITTVERTEANVPNV
jgi:iron complex transport system ATP-binding protein